MRRWLALVIVISGRASASPRPEAPLLDRLGNVDPVLVGAFGGGHGHGGRAPHGWFIGADTGWAWFLGMPEVAARATTAPREDAWCFGARGGYQLRSGLAVQMRFDKLGVEAPDGSGPLDAISAGVRYSVPIVPMPFAEAMIGPTIHGSDVVASAGLGVGVSVLLARHVAFDATGRDWIVDLGGVHHIPTLTFGITAGFGG